MSSEPVGHSAERPNAQMLIRKEHLPIYMHDLDGSDSLALMVACLRKLQGWNEAAWVEEMSRSVAR